MGWWCMWVFGHGLGWGDHLCVESVDKGQSARGSHACTTCNELNSSSGQAAAGWWKGSVGYHVFGNQVPVCSNKLHRVPEMQLTSSMWQQRWRWKAE
eukprot:918144-Pelagomonas_calceolata.AAC.5